ncbi:MAG: PadR family transcriptional regulator [Pseudomonadota bacterium]
MALRYAILTALLDEEHSGYDLARNFDHSLGFFWQASHQQIYRELKKLSEQRFVASHAVAQEGRPDRIVYSLTESGKAALDDWVMGADKLRVLEVRDEFFIKLYNLHNENLNHIQHSLDLRVECMRGRLALYEKIRERRYSQPEKLSLRRQGVYLSLMAGIMSSEVHLNWCEMALQLLRERSGKLENSKTGAENKQSGRAGAASPA